MARAESPATAHIVWFKEMLNAPSKLSADDVRQRATVPFSEAVSPDRFVSDVTAWSREWAPVVLESVEEHELDATGILRMSDGSRVRVACTTEPTFPHRIAGLKLGPVHDLYPSLPESFDDFVVPDEWTRITEEESPAPKMIVFCGVPGVGKTTIAERLARDLGIPLFSFDWVLGALAPFDLLKQDSFRAVGYELLTTLALQQLLRRQSLILDSPADIQAVRTRWISLAERFGANVIVFECTCEDLDAHRKRVTNRRKGVPGWRESDWGWVEQRLAAYQSWEGAIQLDTRDTVEKNLEKAHYALSGRLETSGDAQNGRSS